MKVWIHQPFYWFVPHTTRERRELAMVETLARTYDTCAERMRDGSRNWMQNSQWSPQVYNLERTP